MTRLLRHPDTPCSADIAISAEAVRNRRDGLYLRFIIDGAIDRIVLPPRGAPMRTDGLWQTTCCEAFLRPVGRPDYLELNFAPSTAWAAYRFDAYRAGMRTADVAPDMSRIGGIVQILVDLASLPDWHADDWSLGLSAVIEEQDGAKSYWALRHPPGRPDFHHPDCFAMTLGAPPAP